MGKIICNRDGIGIGVTRPKPTSLPSLEEMKHKLNYEGLFFVEGSNNGGDLALPWKEKNMVRLLGYSKNHIDFEVQSAWSSPWHLIGFYGFP